MSIRIDPPKEKSQATQRARLRSRLHSNVAPSARHWGRRLLVISLYAILLASLLVWFLPLLVIAAGCDLLRRQPWTLARTLVFFIWYLILEVAGVAAAAAIWLVGGLRTGRGRESYLARNYRLQALWSRLLGRGGFAIFGMRIAAEGDRSDFGNRPVLVFVRHASSADTILAALLLAGPHGLRLRYVLKRELLWDPCLDVVGNRLPNVFVDRDSVHSEREIASIGALARNLDAGEGVLIYPEGTRFSQDRRRRIVQKLREQGRVAAAEEAESLRNVLRPRSGGALALLEAAPSADAVFLAHTGLEGSASFDRFFNGGLVGRTVHVQIRTVPAEQIPEGRDARRAWLMQQWQAVDEFIESRRDRDGLDATSACVAPRSR